MYWASHFLFESLWIFLFTFFWRLMMQLTGKFCNFSHNWLINFFFSMWFIVPVTDYQISQSFPDRLTNFTFSSETNWHNSCLALYLSENFCGCYPWLTDKFLDFFATVDKFHDILLRPIGEYRNILHATDGQIWLFYPATE